MINRFVVQIHACIRLN